MTQIPIKAPPITAHELLGKVSFLGLTLPFGLYEGIVLSKVLSSFNLPFLWHNFSGYHIIVSVFSINIILAASFPKVHMTFQRLCTPQNFFISKKVLPCFPS